MFGLPSWLLIIPVLAFLIFVHELGHFLAAKRFGIKVLEFGFGFPPRLFGVRYGETIYSINWIPLGGFVRMLGEDNAAGVPDSAEQARLEAENPDPDSGRRFTDKPPYQRVIVLVAGSFMNFVTPVVIFTIIFLLPRDVPVGTVFINGVAPRSPAAEAGIRPGDQILSVNGERVRNHFELIDTVRSSVGTETELNIRRGLHSVRTWPVPGRFSRRERHSSSTSKSPKISCRGRSHRSQRSGQPPRGAAI